jgi:hypothetical protein
MRRLLAMTSALWGPVACGTYAIGDPMPPPPKCPGIAQSIRASVSRSGDTVTLRLEAPTAPSASYVVPPQITVGENVVVTGLTSGVDGLTIVMKIVDDRYDGWGVGVGVMCGGTFGSIAVYLERSRDGGDLTISQIDDQ